MKFNAEKVKNECVAWIRDFFEKNGPTCNAVVGISGGKDSSIVAAMCVEALGKDRVIGVLMPNGEQPDIEYAYKLVNHLGIRYYVVNIKDGYRGIVDALPEDLPLSNNLSEDWVGYSTRYGDAAGDFSPLSHLTVQEVKAIARLVKLPEELIEKKPSDGLCGKTDEDNLGFTYATLDRYIRTGEIDSAEDKEKIDRLHRRNLFKLALMPSFDPGIETKPE